MGNGSPTCRFAGFVLEPEEEDIGVFLFNKLAPDLKYLYEFQTGNKWIDTVKLFSKNVHNLVNVHQKMHSLSKQNEYDIERYSYHKALCFYWYCSTSNIIVIVLCVYHYLL